MMKATAMTSKGPLVIFGLSAENIRRLQQGKPIDIDMSELGMRGHIMIFAGKNEDSMKQALTDAGMIDSQTIVHDTSA